MVAFGKIFRTALVWKIPMSNPILYRSSPKISMKILQFNTNYLFSTELILQIAFSIFLLFLLSDMPVVALQKSLSFVALFCSLKLWPAIHLHQLGSYVIHGFLLSLLASVCPVCVRFSKPSFPIIALDISNVYFWLIEC